jgi:hypothetical protein
VDWDYTWGSLCAPPQIVEKGIFLSTGEHKKKVLGLFRHGESGKVILIQDQEQKEVSVLFLSYLTLLQLKIKIVDRNLLHTEIFSRLIK